MSEGTLPNIVILNQFAFKHINHEAGLWHVVQVSLVRPAWSSGTARSPLVWHIRQSSRPSKSCGIAVGSPVGAGAGTGVGFGAGAGAGVGAGTGVSSAHAASTDTMINSATIINQSTDLFLTQLTSLLIWHILTIKGEANMFLASPLPLFVSYPSPRYFINMFIYLENAYW